MSYENAISRIGTLLGTAGASLTPAITRVRRGDFASSPPTRAMAYFYSGSQDSPLIPPTLGDVSYEETVTVTALWPVASDDDSVAAQIDKEMRACLRAVTNALIGDSQLNGNCDDLKLGSPEIVWREMTGQLSRAFLLPVHLTFSEVDDITA